MRHTLFLFLMSFSFNAFCEEDAEEKLNKACAEALDSAQSGIQKQIQIYSEAISNAPPHAVDAASGTPLTGNPITDNLTKISESRKEYAEAQQQEMQAHAQVDNDCFQQESNLTDEDFKVDQREFEGIRQMNTAEAQKKKSESEISLSCWKEASELFKQEMVNLAQYARRLVSTVGGAMSSKQDISELRTKFYNQCFRSPATTEALNSLRADFDLKVRNIATTAAENAAEKEYIQNQKLARLSQHCQLRHEQVKAQAKPAKNNAFQNMGLGLIGLHMATKTSAASAEDKQKVSVTYSSLQDILNAWPKITQDCNKLYSSNAAIPDVVEIPSDAFSYMSKIHTACRPTGANPSLVCFKNTGIPSTQGQNATRATSSR